MVVYYSSIWTIKMIFLKDFIYLFLERGREGEKRERNINVWLPLTCPLLENWPATQACALTEWDPLFLWPVLSPLSHTIQGKMNLIFMLLYHFSDF